MFTRPKDFERLIVEQDLLTILESDFSLLAEVEELAKTKIKGFLSHRYDVEQVFKDIKQFSLTDTFFVGDFVEYSEPAYDENTVYNPGDRFSYDGWIYEVLQTTQGTTPPNDTFYVVICEDKKLFSVRRETSGNYPDDAFRYIYDKNYLTDFDLIRGWQKDKILQVKRQGEYLYLYTDGTKRGFVRYLEDLDLPAKYKIEPITQNQIAGLGGYIRVINEFPDNDTLTVETDYFFEPKDNRNSVVLDWAMKIMLYELHSRINPRQIPDLRVKQYDDTLKELEKCGKGLLNIDIPLRVEPEKRSIPFLFGASPTESFNY